MVLLDLNIVLRIIKMERIIYETQATNGNLEEKWVMNPIKQLMREHRLIEKAAEVAANLRNRLQLGKELRSDKLWKMLDFWSSYADIIHHGKEEQLLFPLIEERNPTTAIVTTIERLIEEHTKLLGYIADVRQAARPFFAGKVAARKRVIGCLDAYIGIIIPHVKLEDQELFPEVNKLLSSQDMVQLEKEFESMDVRITPKVHQFYEELVDNLEKK
jgi:hemerythrin-like domain-containing protein